MPAKDKIADRRMWRTNEQRALACGQDILARHLDKIEAIVTKLATKLDALQRQLHAINVIEQLYVHQEIEALREIDYHVYALPPTTLAFLDTLKKRFAGGKDITAAQRKRLARLHKRHTHPTPTPSRQ